LRVDEQGVLRRKASARVGHGRGGRGAVLVVSRTTGLGVVSTAPPSAMAPLRLRTPRTRTKNRLAGASGRTMRTTSLSLGAGRCRTRIFHVVSAGGRAAAPPGPARGGAGAAGRCVVWAGWPVSGRAAWVGSAGRWGGAGAARCVAPR